MQEFPRLGPDSSRRSVNTSSTTGQGIDRERSGEAPVLLEAPVERRYATSAQPGNPREPGLREVVVEATRTRGQVNAKKLLCSFPVYKKMTVDGRGIKKMIAE